MRQAFRSIRARPIGCRVVVLVLALGIGGGMGVTQLMEGMLFGVSTLDPITFLLGPATLVAVAFLACLGPALKTTATDPVERLNRE